MEAPPRNHKWWSQNKAQNGGAWPQPNNINTCNIIWIEQVKKQSNHRNRIIMAYLPIHEIRSVRDERGSGERRGKITDRSELSVKNHLPRPCSACLCYYVSSFLLESRFLFSFLHLFRSSLWLFFFFLDIFFPLVLVRISHWFCYLVQSGWCQPQPAYERDWPHIGGNNGKC